jgi:hypothetical protein
VSKDNQPGFTVGATRGDDLMPKAKERFGLCAVPALQKLGLPKPTPLEKGEKCRCGAELPRHLFELAGERGRPLTHRCSCGLNWQGEKEDGNFVVSMVQ